MDTPKKMNDCYFYYYSTCIRGAWCAFRHEESALGCESVCPAWQQGQCRNPTCTMRHMELKKNRKTIPCYWEGQPGGCRKEHCAFLHRFRKPEAASGTIADSSTSNGTIDVPVASANANVQQVAGTTDSGVNTSVANIVQTVANVPNVSATVAIHPSAPLCHAPANRPPIMEAALVGVMPVRAPADSMQARRVAHPAHAQLSGLPLGPHPHPHPHPHPPLLQNPPPNPTYLPVDPLLVNFEESMRLY